MDVRVKRLKFYNNFISERAGGVRASERNIKGIIRVFEGCALYMGKHVNSFWRIFTPLKIDNVFTADDNIIHIVRVKMFPDVSRTKATKIYYIPRTNPRTATLLSKVRSWHTYRTINFIWENFT